MIHVRLTVAAFTGLGMAFTLVTPAFAGGVSVGYSAAGRSLNGSDHGGRVHGGASLGGRFQGVPGLVRNGLDRSGFARNQGVTYGGYGNGVPPNQVYARPTFYSAPGFAGSGYNGTTRYTYGTVYNQPRLGYSGYGRGYGYGVGSYDAGAPYEGTAYGPQGIDFGGQGYGNGCYHR